jgi:hypothetical protein
MLKFSLIPLLLAAGVSLLFGVRYLFTQSFMPYHAVVSGKAWAELERGMQAAILGMLRVAAGGFLAYGLALLWLALPLNRGELWAAWAALTITLGLCLPVLYVTLGLRRFAPAAKPPVAAPLVVMVLVLTSVGAAFISA